MCTSKKEAGHSQVFILIFKAAVAFGGPSRMKAMVIQFQNDLDLNIKSRRITKVCMETLEEFFRHPLTGFSSLLVQQILDENWYLGSLPPSPLIAIFFPPHFWRGFEYFSPSPSSEKTFLNVMTARPEMAAYFRFQQSPFPVEGGLERNKKKTRKHCRFIFVYTSNSWYFLIGVIFRLFSVALYSSPSSIASNGNPSNTTEKWQPWQTVNLFFFSFFLIFSSSSSSSFILPLSCFSTHRLWAWLWRKLTISRIYKKKNFRILLMRV